MGDNVSYLYEPQGSELHWEGLKPIQTGQPQQASLSGPAPQYSHPVNRQGMQGTSPQTPVQQATRRPTDDELMATAMKMFDNQSVQHHAQLAAGPATGNRDESGGKVPDWLTNYMSPQDPQDPKDNQEGG